MVHNEVTYHAEADVDKIEGFLTLQNPIKSQGYKRLFICQTLVIVMSKTAKPTALIVGSPWRF